jgi:hypothetical protein
VSERRPFAVLGDKTACARSVLQRRAHATFWKLASSGERAKTRSRREQRAGPRARLSVIQSRQFSGERGCAIP